MAKRALSPFLIHPPLSSCQVSAKSLERLSGKSDDTHTDGQTDFFKAGTQLQRDTCHLSQLQNCHLEKLNLSKIWHLHTFKVPNQIFQKSQQSSFTTSGINNDSVCQEKRKNLFLNKFLIDFLNIVTFWFRLDVGGNYLGANVIRMDCTEQLFLINCNHKSSSDMAWSYPTHHPTRNSSNLVFFLLVFSYYFVLLFPFYFSYFLLFLLSLVSLPKYICHCIS